MRMELGRCKFCGTEHVVEAETLKEADEEVTNDCDCSGAIRHRRFERARDILACIEVGLDGEHRDTIQDISQQLTRLEEVLE